MVSKKKQTKRITIPINEELLNCLIELKQQFKDMYGNDVEQNSEVPYVHWNIFNDQKSYSPVFINIMRKCGIPEYLVYAYYKTGRIITEENEKFLTKEDLKEFDYYCSEYKKLMNEELKNNKCNIIQLVNFANHQLSETFEKFYSYLHNTLHDCIKRHLEECQDFLNYKISSETDYIGFCCIKTLKDLESIKTLLDMRMVENIYCVCRSLFEAYIQIVNLAHNKNFFDTVLTNVANCKYDFKTLPDGSVNYNELIIKKQKTKDISIKELCKNSPYKTDNNLYDIFYRSACQFIHLDVMSAKSYFHGYDPFCEIDSSLIAALTGITFLTLMISEFSNIKCLKPQYKKDSKYLANQLKKDLIFSYKIITSDEYNRNELFNSIINRLEENIKQ